MESHVISALPEEDYSLCFPSILISSVTLSFFVGCFHLQKQCVMWLNGLIAEQAGLITPQALHDFIGTSQLDKSVVLPVRKETGQLVLYAASQ